MFQEVACIGAGVIGKSWAVSYALQEVSVRLYVRNPEKKDSTIAEIREMFQDLVSCEVLKPEQVDQCMTHIHIYHDLSQVLDGISFIQESLPEKIEIKHEFLKSVDQYAPADAIVASSTSGLSIREIAKGSVHPERVIGGHPFNPPHLLPLVEMTALDPECAALKTAYDFYKAVGKEPVILKKDSMGFIGNRLSYALYREAIDLVVRGVASIEDVDKAVAYGPGFRWALFGPFATYNLGSPNGIGEMEKKYGKTLKYVLQDMASWVDVPDVYPEMVQDGVDAEIANFSDAIGHSRDDMVHFRNKGLITLLKLHGKL